MSTVTFKGNIGKVRGLQFSNDGKPRFSFSVAESHSKPDGNGGFTDIGTTWWAVTVFGRDAETLADTIQEGAKQRVSIHGRALTREYEANGEKRTSLDVIADIVGIIPKSQQGAANTQQPAAQSGFGGQQSPPNNFGNQQHGQGGWGNQQGQSANQWGNGQQAGQDNSPPF